MGSTTIPSGFHSVRHGRLLQVANRLKAPLAKLKNNAISRSLALLLVALGVALMFLAPETWAGLVLLVFGGSLELIGIALRHRGSS